MSSFDQGRGYAKLEVIASRDDRQKLVNGLYHLYARLRLQRGHLLLSSAEICSVCW